VVHSVVGVWRIVGAGDQRFQRWESSDHQGTSVLDSGDIDERSRQACTAPAEECQASAVHRGAAVTDLDCTCRQGRISKTGTGHTEGKLCNYLTTDSI